MKAEKKKICLCCGKEQAETHCDHCGVALCTECSNLELWGTGAESLSFRYFCQTCKNDPAVNSWDAKGAMPAMLAKKVRKAEPRFILPRPAGFPYPDQEPDTVGSVTKNTHFTLPSKRKTQRIIPVTP